MKQNEIQDSLVTLLGSYNFENMFDVYVNEDGQYFYNIIKGLYFPEDINPSLYGLVEPLPGELLPQLSFRVYNVVNLWWLIAALNNISDPLEPLNPGVKLKIIDSTVIRDVLNQIKEQ